MFREGRKLPGWPMNQTSVDSLFYLSVFKVHVNNIKGSDTEVLIGGLQTLTGSKL